MENCDTVVAAFKGLKSTGYPPDFTIAFDKSICNENGLCLNLNEFDITEPFRFEGDTNPANEKIVYAIESKDDFINGSSITTYLVYADTNDTEVLKKITINHHQ